MNNLELIEDVIKQYCIDTGRTRKELNDDDYHDLMCEYILRRPAPNWRPRKMSFRGISLNLDEFQMSVEKAIYTLKFDQARAIFLQRKNVIDPERERSNIERAIERRIKDKSMTSAALEYAEELINKSNKNR